VNLAHTWTRTAVTAVAVCGLLAGCGGGGKTFVSDGRPTPGPVSTRPVNSFEIYLQASTEGNVLFADVYGLELRPLHVDRLTAGKRISTMEADAEHVAVASADSDIGDRLGYVGDGGSILDIPGLGRPNAFAPVFDRDGTLLFQQNTKNTSGAVVTQFFRYDERSGRKTLLLQGDEHLSGPFALPDGFLAYSIDSPKRTLLVKKGNRTIRSFPDPESATELMIGARLAAFELDAAGSNFGDKPTDTLLLDLKSGKQRTVVGWQPLCWDPAGTKLLVRRTANTTNSELALLDPDHPDAVPQPLGTIPHLVIYHGAWVARH